MTIKSVAIFAATVSTIALYSGAASAQSASTDLDAKPETGGLEEIIVTAQKRAENLQDVPIAVSAITASTLSQSGVTNTDTLNQTVPGLQVSRQIGASNTYLRGVGSQSTVAGDEGSIANYVDGVYRISLYSSIQSFNNIERVEVLKGPQGTLFGRNATGGLVHIITKDPSYTTSAEASAGYGSYETVQFGFYGTTGLSDSIAADLSVTYTDQGKGFGRNIFTGTEVNKTRDFSIRSKILWEPGTDTRVIFSADYGNQKSSQTIARQLAPGTLGFDGAIIFAGCVAGLGGNPGAPTPTEAGTCAPVAVAGASRPTGDFYNINQDSDPFYTAKSYGGSIQVNQKLGGVDLVSITSYREAQALQLLDQDGTRLPLIFAPLQTSVDDFQQELRLESANDGPFKWIVGAYYLDSTSQYDNFNLSGIGVAGLVPGAIAYRASPIQKTTSLAGFVQASYELASQTTITAGIRYTRDKRTFRSSNQVVFGPGAFFTSLEDFQQATYTTIPVDATGALSIERSATFSEPSWRLSIDHKFDNDLLIFASYNRGFKSGVFNASNSANPGPVQPEKLDAYEIGFKSEFADRVVRLNGSVFYYDYKNLQLQAIALGSTVLLNAATARNKGAELELQIAPSSHFNVHASASYLDAKYKSFPAAPFYTPTGIGGNASFSGDASGNRLLKAPKLTFNVGANANVDTGVGKFEVFGNLYYNDGFFWEPQNIVRENAYVLVNLGASLEINETVKLNASVDNVLDTEYSNYSDNGTFGSTVSGASPRLFRAGVQFKF